MILLQLDNGNNESESDSSDSCDDGSEANSEEDEEGSTEEKASFKDSHRPRDESPNSRKVLKDDHNASRFISMLARISQQFFGGCCHLPT